jgi:hypothetical protein
MRATGALLVILAGCAVPPPPPPLEPAASGATLYVLEAWNDFLDDGGKLYDPTLGLPGMLGEQALAIVLRIAGRGKQAKGVGTDRATIREGRPARLEARLPSGELVAVDSMMVLWDRKAYADVNYLLFRGAAEIEAGVRILPLGGSLLWWIPRDGDRGYLLLLHVASVER